MERERDERLANNEMTEAKAIVFRNGIGIICGFEPYLNCAVRNDGVRGLTAVAFLN